MSASQRVLLALVVLAACISLASAVDNSEGKRRHVHHKLRHARTRNGEPLFVHLKAKTTAGGEKGAHGTILEGTIEDTDAARANSVVLRESPAGGLLRAIRTAAVAAGSPPLVFKTVVLDSSPAAALADHEAENERERVTLAKVQERMGADFTTVAAPYFGSFSAQCVKNVAAPSPDGAPRAVTLKADRTCLYLVFGTFRTCFEPFSVSRLTCVCSATVIRVDVQATGVPL